MIGTVVNKYEGTIDKFIGDAVMVLFGALISHENDPERAIRSALEMQETLENFNKENEIPLSVSIGINTGTAALNTLNYYSDFTVINVIKWKNVASLRLKQIKVFHDYEKYDYYDEKFILGIVNSRLESFYFNKTMRSGLHTLPNNVKNLLLPIIAEID